jgi:hypothetical protein
MMCRMRASLRIVTVAAVLGLALAPAGASASAAKAKRTCYPAHSTTLAASKSVRVYQTRGVSRDTKTHATYGCLLTAKRPHRFVVLDFPMGFEHITIAGRFVAYAAYSDCAADYCNPNAVMVHDLKTGRRTFAEGSRVAVANVSDLVLRSDGSVAWIETSFDDNGSILQGFDVVAGGPGRAPVVLDSGADVAPGSLALAGRTVYWTRAGEAHSASLD